MNIKLFRKVVKTFIIFFILEFIALLCLGLRNIELINTIIQFALLNIAAIAFYTWAEDNKVSSVGLLFELNKDWDKNIKIIDKEFCDVRNKVFNDGDKFGSRGYEEQLNVLETHTKKLDFFAE